MASSSPRLLRSLCRCRRCRRRRSRRLRPRRSAAFSALTFSAASAGLVGCCPLHLCFLRCLPLPYQQLLSLPSAFLLPLPDLISRYFRLLRPPPGSFAAPAPLRSAASCFASPPPPWRPFYGRCFSLLCVTLGLRLPSASRLTLSAASLSSAACLAAASAASFSALALAAASSLASLAAARSLP